MSAIPIAAEALVAVGRFLKAAILTAATPFVHLTRRVSILSAIMGVALAFLILRELWRALPKWFTTWLEIKLGMYKMRESFHNCRIRSFFGVRPSEQTQRSGRRMQVLNEASLGSSMDVTKVETLFLLLRGMKESLMDMWEDVTSDDVKV